ncbi:MAG: hypothetical protein RR276_03220 [Angelakisella sp.]
MEPRSHTPEEQFRELILSRYRSVRAFAVHAGLPCSTVDNLLRRGICSVNLSTATVICDALELDIAALVQGRLQPATGGASSWEGALLDDVRALDNHGRELVAMVAGKERQRCQAAGAVVAFPQQNEGWRQYVGTPIACRGGGVTAATEQDARQMETIYRRLVEHRPAAPGSAKGKDDHADG